MSIELACYVLSGLLLCLAFYRIDNVLVNHCLKLKHIYLLLEGIELDIELYKIAEKHADKERNMAKMASQLTSDDASNDARG